MVQGGGRALKPHELSAKLKKGSHSRDGNLHPVRTDEYHGVFTLGCKDVRQPLITNNPSKSKCKPQGQKAAAMRIRPPASPTTRGAVRRMQEEESRLSPWAAA
eukprot:1159264-Pelagomonas_calceolata.AAC.3